jgi:hypothetical protein
MIEGHATASSIKSNDLLENYLKEATTEESRQLLEQFLRAFYLDKPEIAVGGTGSSAVTDLRK